MKMPIPTDWDGQSFCRFAVCWPDSPLWRIILRGLLTEPTRGYFWDERTGSIIGVLADIRQTMDYNIKLQEVVMACGDTGLSEGLQAIAQAIITASLNNSVSIGASSACCEQTIIAQNGGVVQYVTPISGGQDVPMYGTQPPIGVESGSYPEGYESLEEYQVSKCEIANLIVDGLIGSLRNLGAISLANLAGLAGLILVAIIGLISFPPAAIGLMIGFLLMLTGAVGMLKLAGDDVEENRSQWVCYMYTSDNTEAVIAVIADLIDALIANIGATGTIGIAIKSIVLLLMNSDTLNQLFKYTAHLNYPEADCSTCQECTGEAWDFAGFDAQGWTLGVDNGTGSTLTPGDGFIIVHSNGGQSPGTRILSPIFSHIIQPGDRLNWYFTNPVLSSFGAWLTLDGVPEVEISWPNSSNPMEVSASVDLTPWAGQEATRIYLYASPGSGIFPDVDYNYLCVTIGCPEAEPENCI